MACDPAMGRVTNLGFSIIGRVLESSGGRSVDATQSKAGGRLCIPFSLLLRQGRTPSRLGGNRNRASNDKNKRVPHVIYGILSQIGAKARFSDVHLAHNTIY